MKKLLLILIALPMIGFGQMDKLIFSSGDTIYGKVIEVGVNDITYQHKNESINNVKRKRELAKVIYSSGRIETFQGLGILESKIAKEENEKLYIQEKKARRKNKKNLNFENWEFKIGATSFFPFTRKDEIIVFKETKGNEQRAEIFELYSARIGINTEALYNHKINNKTSIVNSLAYYSVKFQKGYEGGGPEIGQTNQYLSFSVMGSYYINSKFSVLSGISFDKIFYSKSIVISSINLLGNSGDPPMNNEFVIEESIKDNSHVSLVFSTKYTIFKQLFIYSDIKLPIVLLQSLSPTELTLYRILENNRYLALGIGIDL
jgi:hypothetical protein